MTSGIEAIFILEVKTASSEACAILSVQMKL